MDPELQATLMKAATDLLNIAVPVVIGILSWAAKRALDAIRERSKHDATKTFIRNLQSFTELALADLGEFMQDDIVEALRDGKLTEDELMHLKVKVKQRVVYLLGKNGMGSAKDLAVDSDMLLRSIVASFIHSIIPSGVPNEEKPTKPDAERAASIDAMLRDERL